MIHESQLAGSLLLLNHSLHFLSMQRQYLNLAYPIRYSDLCLRLHAVDGAIVADDDDVEDDAVDDSLRVEEQESNLLKFREREPRLEQHLEGSKVD